MKPRHDSTSRRELLRWSVAGAAGLGLASWLTGCFDPAAPEGARTADAEGARPAARRLLVLVVPEDDELKYGRGQEWGALLLHGSRDVRAELATCELLCATLDELRERRPELVGLPAGECCAVLVEPGATRARVLVLESTLPEAPASYENRDARERHVRERLDAQSAALAAFLAPNPGTAAAGSGGAANVAAPAEVDAAFAAAQPVAARALAGSRPEQREAWLDALAASFDEVARAAPEGSHWAKSEGCGTEILDVDNGGVRYLCGMGHVPELSQQFLWLFSELP